MEAIAFLGLIALVFISFIYASLAWGFVLLKFYTWFVLPVFTTLPVINYWQAVGLIFFLGLFNRYIGEGLKKEFKDETTYILTAISLPWISLFFGWLTLHLFII